jgi:hypothetical protein
LLALEVLGQQRLVLGPLLRDDVEAAARGQRRENHRVAEIGGNGRHGGMLHPGVETQPLADPQDVVDDVAVLDTHALGPSGGAAGVDHVGEIVRPDPSLASPRPVRDGPVERIQAHHLRRLTGQPREQALLREQARDIGIREHEGDSLRRIRRVDRQVGGSGLQDPEDSGHHLQRALDEQPDARIRPKAQCLQAMRELIGPVVELPVGQPLVLEHHRDLIGRSVNLRFDQLV